MSFLISLTDAIEALGIRVIDDMVTPGGEMWPSYWRRSGTGSGPPALSGRTRVDPWNCTATGMGGAATTSAHSIDAGRKSGCPFPGLPSGPPPPRGSRALGMY